MMPQRYFIVLLLLLCARLFGADAPALPRPDHVVIVINENKNYDQIIGNSKVPYINMLAKMGVNFTVSFGVTHPSQPNYYALFCGDTKGLGDTDNLNQFTDPN